MLARERTGRCVRSRWLLLAALGACLNPQPDSLPTNHDRGSQQSGPSSSGGVAVDVAPVAESCDDNPLLAGCSPSPESVVPANDNPPGSPSSGAGGAGSGGEGGGAGSASLPEADAGPDAATPGQGPAGLVGADVDAP